MDADTNKNPELGSANLPPALTRQQADVFQLLKDLSTERDTFHEWYLGAIQVLASRSSDKISQAANSLRELCEKLATRLNVEDFQSPLPQLKNVLKRFPQLKSDVYSKGWAGNIINEQLNNFLVDLEETAKLFDKTPRTARLKVALTTSDPQAEFMSKDYREARDQVFARIGRFFENVAHHRHKADLDEFQKELSGFESLLLNYLTPCTAAQQKELLGLMAGLANDAAFSRVSALILHKTANFHFFFDKLDNPNWLLFLDQKGVFQQLPGPEPTGDGRIMYRHHLPLMVLTRLAGSIPKTVTSILIRLRLPDNPCVGDQVLQCITKISDPDCITQLHPLIVQLGQGSARTSWLWIQELLKSWSALKVFPEVFAVLRAYLNSAVGQLARQEYDTHGVWLVKEVDQKCLDDLTLQFPVETAELVFHALSRWFALECERNKQDITDGAFRSYLVEDFKTKPPEHRGVEATLAKRLFSAAQQVYLRGDLAAIDKLDRLLRSNPWHLFRRLRWQLYADFPTHTLEHARDEMLQRVSFLNEINYSRGSHDYEFAQLLVVHVKFHGGAFLSASEVEKFVATVMKGPVDNEGKLLEGDNDFFYRKQLWPIAPLLRGAQLTAYRQLVPDDDKIHIRSYKPHSFGGVSGGSVISEAPPEADALESMGNDQLWTFLNTWQPAVSFPTSEHWVQQDEFALGTKFATTVDKQPERFAPTTKWWENINRQEILHKILERAANRIAKKQNDDKTPVVAPSETDWGNWLGIAKWIMSHTWSRESVARFLGKASESDHAIPKYYFLEFPKLLSCLVEEPDIRLEGHKNSFSDWLTTAINSIRGEAIEALLNLALRQSNSGNEIEPWIFKLIRSRLELPKESPATFALLGAKLRLCIHLFNQALKDSPNLLFPPDRLEHRSAAIVAHFNYDHPWNAIIETFPEFIRMALDTLEAMRAHSKDEDANENRREFASQLGTHIACYYWSGTFASDTEGEAALDRFFAFASPSARAMLINQIASIWEKHSSEPEEDKTIRRVLGIWERRYAQIEKMLKGNKVASSEYELELAESIDWLNCECFSFEWRFVHAKLALQQLKKAPRAYRLLKAISEFGLRSDRLESMLELLKALLQRPSDELRWSIQPKDLIPVISLGLASDKPKTKKLAEECKDLLLKMGFSDFLSL